MRTHDLLTLVCRKPLYSAGWAKKKNAKNQVIFSVLRWKFGLSCDPPGARTQDPNIKSVVLYQLSSRIIALADGAGFSAWRLSVLRCKVRTFFWYDKIFACFFIFYDLLIMFNRLLVRAVAAFILLLRDISAIDLAPMQIVQPPKKLWKSPNKL